MCLASPEHLHGRLAAAAAQARWRCFSIICDCAWVGPALSRARPRKPCGPSDARPVQCRGTAPSRPQAPRPRARCLGLAQAPRLGAQRRDTSSKTPFFFEEVPRGNPLDLDLAGSRSILPRKQFFFGEVSNANPLNLDLAGWRSILPRKQEPRANLGPHRSRA